LVKDSQIKITDTVVMGDVNQTISGNECPGCFASNVRVMMCQISDCETKFCELCHAKSRFSEGHFERFDSGKGTGPFCAKCLISTKNQYEEKKRLERERVERERVERARVERERIEQILEERERKDEEREITARKEAEKREITARKEYEQRVITARKEAEKREREKRIHLAKESEKRLLLAEKNRKKTNIDVEIDALDETPHVIDEVAFTTISLFLAILWMGGDWREIVSKGIWELVVFIVIWFIFRLPAAGIILLAEWATGVTISPDRRRVKLFELEKQHIDAEYELEIASHDDD